MHVRVCIVAFRNPDDIAQCIAALARQTYEQFEVVICENGGAAAQAEVASRLPAALPGGQTVRLIADESNPGYAGGVNNCIAAEGAADAFWILNPDTVAEPATLQALVARLSDGSADAVGGPLLDGDGNIGSCGGQWISLLAYARSIGMGRAFSEAPTAAMVERKMRFISGASMLCSRHFVDVAGVMRKDYFLYCEEVEWCLRAAQKGLKLGYCPEARVVHHQGSSTGSFEAVKMRGRLPVYCNERNRILTLRDTEPHLLLIGVFGALAVIIYFYGRHRAWRQLLIALVAWRDGVMNRRGKPAWLSA